MTSNIKKFIHPLCNRKKVEHYLGNNLNDNLLPENFVGFISGLVGAVLHQRPSNLLTFAHDYSLRKLQNEVARRERDIGLLERGLKEIPLLEQFDELLVCPHMYEKEESIKEEVAKLLLNTSPLCRTQNMDGLVDALYRLEFTEGDVVFRQNSIGDVFYIIQSGKFLVKAKFDGRQTEENISELGANDIFGELALLYNQPRSATITVLEDGITWALEKIQFVKYLMHNFTYNRNLFLPKLSEIAFFNVLSYYDKLRFCDLIEMKTFKEKFYLVRRDSVKKREIIILFSGSVLVQKIFYTNKKGGSSQSDENVDTKDRANKPSNKSSNNASNKSSNNASNKALNNTSNKSSNNASNLIESPSKKYDERNKIDAKATDKTSGNLIVSQTIDSNIIGTSGHVWNRSANNGRYIPEITNEYFQKSDEAIGKKLPKNFDDSGRYIPHITPEYFQQSDDALTREDSKDAETEVSDDNCTCDSAVTEKDGLREKSEGGSSSNDEFDDMEKTKELGVLGGRGLVLVLPQAERVEVIVKDDVTIGYMDEVGFSEFFEGRLSFMMEKWGERGEMAIPGHIHAQHVEKELAFYF